MKIKEIIYQHRRDFRAIYVCEHCGNEYEDYGYDDDNFHKEVIPTMKGPKCQKTASKNYIPRQTKYYEWEVI